MNINELTLNDRLIIASLVYRIIHKGTQEEFDLLLESEKLALLNSEKEGEYLFVCSQSDIAE